MARKIYITEAQLRCLMRAKINEDASNGELDVQDIYRVVRHLVANSELEVKDSEWVDDDTLCIYYGFEMDSEDTIELRVMVHSDLDYTYEYEQGSYYDQYGDPGTPDYFEDNYNFNFDIRPEDITIMADYGEKELPIDNETYLAIKDKVSEYATKYFEEEYDYDKHRENYCYNDDGY
jgi:hypothetical protein